MSCVCCLPVPSVLAGGRGSWGAPPRTSPPPSPPPPLPPPPAPGAPPHRRRSCRCVTCRCSCCNCDNATRQHAHSRTHSLTTHGTPRLREEQTVDFTPRTPKVQDNQQLQDPPCCCSRPARDLEASDDSREIEVSQLPSPGSRPPLLAPPWNAWANGRRRLVPIAPSWNLHFFFKLGRRRHCDESFPVNFSFVA